MSIEIEEDYENLTGFYYLLSLSYENFSQLAERWKDKSNLRTIFSRIKDMCKEVIRSKGKIRRIYNNSLTSKKGQGGRLFGPTSIQFVPREVRGLLMQHTTDIDMKNAHPRILLYLAKQYNYNSPHLEYYVNNRDVILKKFPDKNTGKVTYLKALNKNSISKDIKDFPEEQRIGLLDFSKEMMALQKQFMKNPDFADMKESIEYRKYNKEGSFINKCICIVENNILMEMKDFLVQKGHIIRCLAFDGLMINGNHYENVNLLKELENHINVKFEGLKMEYDYKEHDNEIEIPSDFKVDEKLMKNDDAYEQWKKEFEKSHCKIINKSFFIKCIKDESDIILEFKIFTRKELVTSYEHIKVQKEMYNEKKDEIVKVQVDCITDWLSDSTMKTYDDMNIFPPPLECPSNIFNLWTPYYADQLPKSTLEERENENNIDKVNMVLNLIKVLCNDDEKDTEFVIKFIGQLLKFPALKTYCLTFISEEGAGKGTLTYLIERLVGERRFLESTDPSRDVWGNFNELMQDAIVVCCDELDQKSQMQCEGKIKGLITNKNLTVNPKGQKPFKMNSYHRFIFTTNKSTPVQTHKNDRRNKVIRASDELCGEKDIFDKIRSGINDDVVLRLLYEHFTELSDLDAFHLLGIEQNSYQQILTETSTPAPDQFLEHLTTSTRPISEMEYTPEKLFLIFNEFKLDNDIRFQCNSTKFIQQLKLLKIPLWYKMHRTSTSRNIVIDFTVLETHYQKKYLG